MSVDGKISWARPGDFSWKEGELPDVSLNCGNAELCCPSNSSKFPGAERLNFKEEIRLESSAGVSYETILDVINDVLVLMQDWKSLAFKMKDYRSCQAYEWGPGRKGGAALEFEAAFEDTGQFEACLSHFKQRLQQTKSVLVRAQRNCMPVQLPLEIMEKIWGDVRKENKALGFKQPQLTLHEEGPMQTLEQEKINGYFSHLSVLFNYLLAVSKPSESFYERAPQTWTWQTWANMQLNLERAEHQLWQVLDNLCAKHEQPQLFNKEQTNVVTLTKQDKYCFQVRKVLPLPRNTIKEPLSDATIPWTSLDRELVLTFVACTHTTVAILWDLARQKRLASISMYNTLFKDDNDHQHIFLTGNNFYLLTWTSYLGESEDQICDTTIVRWPLDHAESDAILEMKHIASTAHIRIYVDDDASSTAATSDRFDLLQLVAGDNLLVCKDDSREEEDVFVVQYVNSTRLYKAVFDPLTGQEINQLNVPHKMDSPVWKCHKGDTFVFVDRCLTVSVSTILPDKTLKTFLLEGNALMFGHFYFDRSPNSNLLMHIERTNFQSERKGALTCRMYDLDTEKPGTAVASTKMDVAGGLGIYLEGIVLHNRMVYMVDRAMPSDGDDEGLSLLVFDPFRREGPVEICSIAAGGTLDIFNGNIINKDVHSIFLPRTAHGVGQTCWLPQTRNSHHWLVPGGRHSIQLPVLQVHRDSSLTVVCSGHLVEVQFGVKSTLEEEAKDLQEYKKVEKEWEEFWKRQRCDSSAVPAKKSRYSL